MTGIAAAAGGWCYDLIMSPMFAGLAAAGLLGCTMPLHEDPCGHQRSLTVQDTLPALTINLSIVDEEDRPDGFSWEITVSDRGAGVTAVHLHDGTPGNGGRMLYDLTTTDLDLSPGFTVAGGGVYSYTTSIQSLFELVRSGNTYIDVHTRADPEGALRADLKDVQFEDWSGYYCS